VTRERAGQLLARLKRDDLPFYRADHFWQEMKEEGYFIDDVWAILRTHVLEADPEWNELHQNFKVTLRGTCLEGRPTRLLLGLREDGSCSLITIMGVK
jgi:hypothetical protein